MVGEEDERYGWVERMSSVCGPKGLTEWVERMSKLGGWRG